MDPELSNCSSSTIDSIRKAGIGRRGGITVRGGRLPQVPIQSALTKKKVIAPKIPQRRVKVKKEEGEQFKDQDIKHQMKFQERGRGRGRGRGTKVYIQTEGTLLGDGPSLRVKKERNNSGYERVSTSRCSKNFGIKSEDSKVNSIDIDQLLKPYDGTEIESDSESDLKPIKYPYVKESKHNIKKEVIDPEDVKQFIKVEPPDDDELSSKSDLNVPEGKFFVPIKRESLPGMTDMVANIKKIRDNVDLMMLLQLPSCLPFEIQCDESEKQINKKQTPSTSKTNKEEQNKKIYKKVSIRDLPEGYIGKFQVLKSGKMRLVMGSTHIYLENGNTPEYLSEVVYIPVQEKEVDLIVLGKIAQKMILQPYFNDITD